MSDLSLGLKLDFDPKETDKLNILLKKVNQINRSVKQASTIINQYAMSTQQVNKQVSDLNNTYGRLVKTVKEGEGYTKKWTATYRDSSGVITQVSNKLNQHGEILKRTTKETKSYGDSFTSVMSHNLGKMLSWGVAAGVLYGGLRKINEAFKTLTDFDVEKVNILKVLNENTSFAPFEKGAKVISQQYGVAIKDVTTAMQTWARQVKDTNAVLTLTNASMKAVAVTDITLESSFKSLSAIMAQFKLQVADSYHIVDVFNELSNNMRVRAEDLAQGLQRTGSAAKLMGVDFNRAAAMVGTLVEVTGATGSQAGTILNRMFSRVHAKETVEALRDLNINAFQPMKNTLDQIGIGWNQYSKSEQEAIAKSLGGMHHWQKLMALFSNYERVIEATLMSYDSLGSANKEIELAMSTFNKKVEQLNAAFQSLVISGGNNLLPTLKAIVDGFRILITIGDGIIPKLAAVAIAIYGVRTALLALNTSTKITSGGLLAVIGILTTLTAAIIGFSNTSNFVDKVTSSISAMEITLSDIGTQIERVGYLGDIYDKLNVKLNSLDKNSKEYISTNKLLGTVTSQIDGLVQKYNVTIQESGNVRVDVKNKIQQLITKLKEEEKAIREKTAQNIENGIREIDTEIQRTEILLKLSRNRMEQYQKETNILGKMKFFMLTIFDPNMWKFFSESVLNAPGKNPFEKMGNAFKGLWSTIGLEFDPTGTTKKLENDLNQLKNSRNQLVKQQTGLELGNILDGINNDDWDIPDPEDMIDKIAKIKETLANELIAIDNQAAAYKRLGKEYDSITEKINAYSNATSSLSRIAPNDNDLIKWAEQLAKYKPEQVMNELDLKLKGIQEQFNASGNKAQFYKEQINAIESAIKAIASIDGKSPLLEKLKQQLQGLLALTNMNAGTAVGSATRAKPIDAEKIQFITSAVDAVTSALSNLGDTASIVAPIINKILSEVVKNGGNTGSFEITSALKGGFWAIFGEALGRIFNSQRWQAPKLEYNPNARTGYLPFEELSEYNRGGQYLQQLQEAQQRHDELMNVLGGETFYYDEIQRLRTIITDLTNKINNISIGKVLDAFGIGTNDITEALHNAFDASTYMDFLSSWSTNLESITRNALIKSFMASTQFQGFYSTLSDKIWAAIGDNNLTSAELADIKNYSNSMNGAIGQFYNMLNQLGLNGGSGGGSGGGSASYTAGSSVPITYNNYITIQSMAFAGNEDEARSFALLLNEYVVAEQGRG